MIGNFRRRILYPLLVYGRKCTDTEPVKLAKTASAVKASFAGAGVQRAASPLCRGAGAAAHCWGQGATPIGGLRAASLIGSRVKRLAQGKLMPASTCTGYITCRRIAGFCSFAAESPLGEILRNGGKCYLKLTRHNGRAGKNGTYNPKHNDRRFDVENSDHIDTERAKQNIYWDCFNGYRTFADREEEPELAATFEEVEQLYYVQKYSPFVEGQNARNAQTRHTERNRSIEEIRMNKKTCPEETVYQIGNMEEYVSPEVLLQVVTEFIAELNRRFGSHIHTLDWALHLDESTPHIHERHVFDCENKYGELFPQQEKALEALGFELPEPEKKPSRYNNRKMVFDSACRVLLFEVAKKHGLHLEEEPEYGGRKYLEKQDFILAKQKERMAAQGEIIEQQQTVISEQLGAILHQNQALSENAKEIAMQGEKLEKLTLKLEDVEQLIDDVSDIAYDKAVEVVTDTVRIETHQEDMRLVDETKRWLLSLERKAPLKQREFAVKYLDSVMGKIGNAMKTALHRIQQKLMQPDMRNAGKQQVKEQARESILEKLKRNQRKVDQENAARKQARQNARSQETEL